ncbi:murein transglycosylase [Amylibacter ulvae]|uniref:Murein transglycosylase n=1 Tax=Paramylibacter ulvae TaxID=1651968 RepID=A0ABQ3D863_9RHOB|nr:lytic murein transglycosylase [Amylibacter ulvae]GHA59549.1 murein transglycosylase [Amylibacter ulvae]
MKQVMLGGAAALFLAIPNFGIAGETGNFNSQENIVVAQTQAGFERWVKSFRAKALTKGVSAKTYDRAFRGVKLNQTVIGYDRKQAEFSRQIWDYLDTATSPKRVTNGQKKFRSERNTLKKIEARYGVDAEVVVAIWGLESSYGENMGDINIIEALATLAYEGRRQKFGETQLLEALRIIQRGDITPKRMNGSWAGAMGHTQFIPTSYQAYAQDFTGDGKRNVWDPRNPSDALASTANYLKKFGWVKGQPWGLEVTLPSGFNYGNASLKVNATPARWTELGVRLVNGGRIPNHGQGSIFLPAGADGPAFVVFKNFGVIKRYNNANSYAMAVGHLADKITGGGEFAREWPRGPGALKLAQKIEVQERLNKAGFDVGDADGILGPNTIDAVSAFQRSLGIVPDGKANQDLLNLLRKRTR